MKTYLITYDLTFPESSYRYSTFISRIKSYQYWAKPFKNTWLVKSSNDVTSLMNYLRPALQFNDKLLIMEVTNDWIALRLPNVVIEWMRSGL